MGVIDKGKDAIRGFGSVGLGMLGGYGILGLLGGEVITGLLVVAIAVLGLVVINGIIETPLDMSE